MGNRVCFFTHFQKSPKKSTDFGWGNLLTQYGDTWEDVAVEVQKRWDQADAAGTLQAPLVESDGEELEGWTRTTRCFVVSLREGA